MARDLADDTYYVTSGGKIPIRWTSPEASKLNYQLFIYLLFTLGTQLSQVLHCKRRVEFWDCPLRDLVFRREAIRFHA